MVNCHPACAIAAAAAATAGDHGNVAPLMPLNGRNWRRNYQQLLLIYCNLKPIDWNAIKSWLATLRQSIGMGFRWPGLLIIKRELAGKAPSISILKRLGVAVHAPGLC